MKRYYLYHDYRHPIRRKVWFFIIFSLRSLWLLQSMKRSLHVWTWYFRIDLNICKEFVVTPRIQISDLFQTPVTLWVSCPEKWMFRCLRQLESQINIMSLKVHFEIFLSLWSILDIIETCRFRGYLQFQYLTDVMINHETCPQDKNSSIRIFSIFQTSHDLFNFWNFIMYSLSMKWSSSQEISSS